jgi:hypothetical protein
LASIDISFSTDPRARDRNDAPSIGRGGNRLVTPEIFFSLTSEDRQRNLPTVNVNDFWPPGGIESIKFNLFCFAAAKPQPR